MSSPIRNIILVGASGNLGPSILSAFLSDPNFTITILTRHSSTSTYPPHLKVHRISDSYPEAELLDAFRGQDAVISTIATAHTLLQKRMADAALKAGVQRFVPSEFGSDTRNAKARAIMPLTFERKIEVVGYLRGKEAEGLSWTAFVTGPFFELAVKRGFMGFDLQSHKATIFNEGADTWSTTKLATIGLAVKNTLLIPDKTANQYLFISSFTVSQRQVLTSLENAERQKWEATHVDAEEQKRVGLEKMANGDFSGALSLIRYINCVHGHGGNFAEYEECANRLLELPEESLDEAVVELLRE